MERRRISRRIAVVALAAVLVLLVLWRATHPSREPMLEEQVAQAVQAAPHESIAPEVNAESSRSSAGAPTESVQPVAETSLQPLVVRVLDERDRALEAAELHPAGRWAANISRPVRPEPGVFEFTPGDARVGARWIASAPGFVAREFALERTDGTLDVRLQAGFVLEGRVAWSDGSPAGPLVRVVAFTAGRPPRSGELLGGAPSGNDWAQTQVREDGTYSLVVPRGASQLDLTAAGDGGMCTPRARVEARDGVVDLSLVPVWAVRVTVREADGSAVKSDAGLFGLGPSWTAPDGFSSVIPSCLEAELLTGWSAQVDAPTPLESLFLLKSSEPAATRRTEFIDGLEFALGIPGYATVSEVLRVPLARTPVAEVQFPLQRTATGWGSLVVEIPAMRPLEGLLRERALASLSLRSLPISRDAPFIALVEGAVTRLDGVPAGRYSLNVTARDGYAQWPGPTEPPFEIAIEPDAELAVRFDQVEFGELDVDVFDAEGEPYTGSLGIQVDCPNFSVPVVFFASFERAPYRITMLRPGTYSLRAAMAAGRNFTEENAVEAVVRSGERGLTGLVLPLR